MQARTTQRIVAVSATALTALAVAACGSSDKAGTSGRSGTSGASAASDVAPVSEGAAQVRLTLASGAAGDECRLDHTRAAAGPVTFSVTNKDATSITEVELVSDQRILGEKENLAPGLGAVTFTVTLGGGTYQVYCPGATTENQAFTVTGQAAPSATGDAATLLASGTKQYGAYAAGVLSDMQTAVGNLKTAVDSGNLADAKARYALARPFYEKVESAVEGFRLEGFKADDNRGNLDYLLDMRESNLDPAVGWRGFHAVERDLWLYGRITAQTRSYAAGLATDTTKLAGLAKTLTYQPEDLANGAAGLLEEVQSNKIKGEEELYSHLDLVDFAANVEGAQQAFAFLKPGLSTIDAGLVDQISKQFDAVNAALVTYHDPAEAGGFTLWTPQLRAADAASLSKTVQALQDPLALIGQKVATAQ
jgi:iron uptake system component EfeO